MVLPDRIELSTSPLPMECSTTELRQHARELQNRPKRPLQAAGSCHKDPSGASTRKPGKTAKTGQNQLGPPGPGKAEPIRFRISTAGRQATNQDMAARQRHRLCSAPQLNSDNSTMTDEKEKRERHNAGPAKDSRQDRLKLALRENLKRRKSQARGRSEPAGASSENHDASLDDANGKGRTDR